MKKVLIVSFIIIFFVSGLYSQKKVYEYDITVKNKVIYARVFYKGKLVDKLKKDDFILFENGKKVPIIGVDVVHKSLGGKNVIIKENIKDKVQPRFFVLIFKIVDYGKHIENGVNYLFDKVLKPEDKLLFMSEHNFFIEDNLKNKDIIKKKILKILERESILSRMNLNILLSKINSLMFSLKEYMGGRGRRTSINSQQKTDLIIQKYLTFIREYKRRYFLPDIDKFYYFSKYLNGIKMQKWVINFYQITKIPVPIEIKEFIEQSTGGTPDSTGLSVTYDIKALETRVQLERELNFPEDFPVKEISKLFYKGDTTFYTILLNKEHETLDKDYYYKNIYTALEKTLKDITFSTGGDVELSNNITKTVNKFEEKKDILYMINYVPTRKNPKLKLIMKDSRYKVKYDPDQFSDYIKKYFEKKLKEDPDINIRNFKNRGNKISFVVTDFKQNKKDSTGKISVSLKITDEKGKTVFNQRKTLKTEKDYVKLNIGFNITQKGFYYLYLDVYDLITKKMNSKFDILKIK